MVVCDVCYNQTSLDPQTADELLEIPIPREHQPGILKKSSQPNNMEKRVPYMNESLLNASSLNKTYQTINNQSISQIINSKREVCKEHGEETTYYCFDCMCRCICSECVVHGAHKTHQVMNVKKAYPLVIERTEDLIGQVNTRIHEVTNVQIFIENKKKELVENTNNVKQEMIKAFDEIRARLNKKEKEILEKADGFLNDNIQELNTFTRVLQTRVISFNKIIDGINANLVKREEVSMLNYYSENKDKIGQSVESEIPELPDFNTLYNLKVNVNQNSFDTMVDTLNAIHVEITAIKGFEITKINNNKQYSIKRDLYGAKVGNNYDNNVMNSSYISNKQNIGESFDKGMYSRNKIY
jgi:hypothetical protein